MMKFFHFNRRLWTVSLITPLFMPHLKVAFKYIFFFLEVFKTSKCVCVGQGVEVDRAMCASSPDLGPVLCEVPCSRDCVLSDWTSWSTCSQTCSSKTMEGKQMRMRSILAYNAGEGASTAALPLKLSSFSAAWQCWRLLASYSKTGLGQRRT